MATVTKGEAMGAITIQVPDNLPLELINEEINNLRTRLARKAHQRKLLKEDEKDPDEKAFNDATRDVLHSPKVQQKLARIDEILTSKNL